MPRLSRLTAQHYRAFGRGVDLELRPLTLLYGKNNAGKSSLVRLLGIIGDSTRESAESPLDLSGDAGKGSTFEELVSAWDRELKRMEIGLSWDDGMTATWTVGLLAAQRNELVEVEQLRVDQRRDGQYQTVAWYGHPRSPEAIAPAGVTPTELTFEGLVPARRGGLPAPLDTLRSRLLELRGKVQYLSAIRALGPGLVQERGVKPSRVRSDGSDAQDALLHDQAARDEVAAWLRGAVGRDLRKSPVDAKTFKWMLPPNDAVELDIPLSSTGEGMAQLVPILAALALRRSPGRPNGLSCFAIEEPTTHLHDDLQIRMAERLAEIAMEPDAPVVMVETHARPLLLGVQLALSRGKLSPGEVILYWIEQDERGRSSVDRVDFDASGLPTSQGLRVAFEDEKQALRELAKARLGAR